LQKQIRTRLRAGIQHHHVLSDPAGGGLQLACGGRGGEIVWIDQKRN